MNIPNIIEITPELVAEHGLKPEEYDRFIKLIGRDPTITELGIVSAMWNEHCSYKSSKKWLKTLPVTGDRVVHGPGENAGVIDIGDGQVAVFKMESHNHPSFIEPHQGAATGVGGILRDVFTMGARPIAALNALRFGEPDHPKTRHLVSGVVAGIGGYGNSFGVPTVGGEVNFHSRYNGNILVNAMAIGLADANGIFLSEAKGVGLPLVYLGAKTGRDGIHGATMASAEFADDADEKRPTVQVGDPFTEKCLLEACLELMASGAVIAIQDMGAAGLTCSAVEMGAKGNLGVELDLDYVPCREDGMSAYEMMLSESQERMLMVLRPELQTQAEEIFAKWGLDFAIVGKTPMISGFGFSMAAMKLPTCPSRIWAMRPQSTTAPGTLPPAPEPMRRQPGRPDEGSPDCPWRPDMCSKAWVWQQYDHLIQSNTASGPGGEPPSSASMARKRRLPPCTDVSPRYVEADPFEGGKQAVAECWRNLTCVGAEPIAITDNLNFGNPERPEIMGTFVKAVEGIGAACLALDFPVVSGNVSLYNETNGKAILPTPAIGGVGLLKDISKRCTLDFKADGHDIILIGGHGTHLGQSMYLREVHGQEKGPPPPVDLARERLNGDFVRQLIQDGEITAAHDISDGGLVAALAEMAIASNKGAKVELPAGPAHIPLFSEDQARYVVTCQPGKAVALIRQAQGQKIDALKIGTVTGNALTVLGHATISLNTMRGAHESWLPAFMDG